MPAFDGATAWLNTDQLADATLRGTVVLVSFWTYTCINWIRTLPYLRAWSDTYGPHGLLVVGVHTPEFDVEHDVENVRRAARDLEVEYPIVVDNGYAVWDAFANQYWPSLYIADAEGYIRHRHFGEGGYERSENVLRQLLADAGVLELPARVAPVRRRAIEAPADWPNVRSSETYLGFDRSQGFASPGGGVLDQLRYYSVPRELGLNRWALQGGWILRHQEAVVNEPNGRIVFRFFARDLNLILVPPSALAGPDRGAARWSPTGCSGRRRRRRRRHLHRRRTAALPADPTARPDRGSGVRSRAPRPRHVGTLLHIRVIAADTTAKERP